MTSLQNNKALSWWLEALFTDGNGAAPADAGENPLRMEGYNVNTPLLDDPIPTAEVQHFIDHQLKAGKGAGPDGGVNG